MKKLLLLLCSFTLALAGCSQSTDNETPPQNEPVVEEVPIAEEEPEEEPEEDAVNEINDEDTKFVNWLDTFVIESCNRDYTLAHHYFVHPENFGIDVANIPVTLGTILPTEDDIEFTRDILEQLKEFNSDDLNEGNAKILDQLTWQFEVQDKMYSSDFSYLPNIWSAMDGIQTTLVTFFSEYQLYTEDDIKPLIELINDTPNYINLGLEYSRKQADLGCLSLDLDALTKSCEKILENPDRSPVITELDVEVDSLMLDDDKAEDYKKQIREAMDKSFFPAFQNIIDGMNDLKSDIKDIQGVANYDHGREYYEQLLNNYSGCPLNIEDTLDELKEKMEILSLQFAQLMQENSSAASKGLYLSTDFDNIEDIMPFLDEHYTQDFPLLDTMDYDLKPLSEEQSAQGVLAYFVIPAIDSTRPYEIRYNALNYGDDPSDFQLYDTFAHEGIPGHMYQYQYNHQNFTHNAQYFQNCLGFSEGYAVYAAKRAQGWLDLDVDELDAYQINEEYTSYMTLVMDLQINGLGMSFEDFTKEYGDGLRPLYNQLAQSPGVFFSYYYGYLMISELREEAMDEMGDDFDEVAFNNALLKYGTLNFDLIRENVDAYIQTSGEAA